MSSILSKLHKWSLIWEDLLFPPHCINCGTPLVRQEEAICLHCLQSLPTMDNGLSQELIGQRVSATVPLHQGLALYQFDKYNSTRLLLHAIKYEAYTSLGFRMGLFMGHAWKRKENVSKPDLIVFVPMSYWKYKKRGYNQAQLLAEGMATVLGIPIDKTCLYKRWTSIVQAKSTKQQRSKNALNSFYLSATVSDRLKDKEVLLVDDIVTTGATVEQCAALLLAAGASKVSIAVLAMTR
ncbi:MAG: double zinc ribbon domain-containing protein [Cytophagaceae bacterium]|jgi:ComF family protein|nr:double zinc ribbon domain-containing protein [Cytophagaceae bacterium]